jgi:hypothetical protein
MSSKVKSSKVAKSVAKPAPVVEEDAFLSDEETNSTESSIIDEDIRNEDLKYGLEKEKEQLGIIRDIFCKKLKKSNDKWFVFDYSCEDCYVELKSRRCNHDKYPDTMIGLNKIHYCSHTKRPVYFCFNFEDGLYYWKYDKKDIDNGNVQIRKGGRTDRGIDETKDYAYIKTEILKKV